MTIEELKAHISDRWLDRLKSDYDAIDDDEYKFLSLAPEILALVEAYRDHEGDDEVTRDIYVGMAYDAFNAKLEAL